MGKRLSSQEKYLESLEMFKKVAPDYGDIRRTIAHLKRRMNQRAEEHYRKGVKFFVNDKLKQAIKEWEQELTLNPHHKKAESDLKNTRNLLERLEKIG